jgi:hypothetical protein
VKLAELTRQEVGIRYWLEREVFVAAHHAASGTKRGRWDEYD